MYFLMNLLKQESLSKSLNEKITFGLKFIKHLTIFYVLKIFYPFETLLKRLKRTANNDTANTGQLPFNFLKRLFNLFKINNCLTYAYVTKSFFNEYGLNSILFVGVKKDKGILLSHSWVELNGNCFQPEHINVSKYDVILRIE